MRIYRRDLHFATIEQLRKVVPEEVLNRTLKPDTDFAKLYYKLSRYISALPEDVSNDIMTDAFTHVFLENLHKNFDTFDGHYLGRENVSIEGYISYLFARALINAGKFHSSRSKKENKDNEDGTLMDAAISNVPYQHNLGNKLTNIEYCQDDIDTYSLLLENTELSDKQRSRYEYKLDNAKRKLQELNNGVCKSQEFDDGVFTVSEEIDFEQLRERIENYINIDEDYESNAVKTFSLLCDGFTKVEIMNYLKMDNKEWNIIMAAIKEAVIDYVAYEKDDKMEKLLIDVTDNGNNMRSSFMVNIPKVDVDKQVKDIYGVDLKCL